MMKVRSLIIFITLFTSINALSQSNQIPDNIEFQVLKDLFDSLGGPSWTNKNNWPAAGKWPSNAGSAQFGTWYGITVTNGDITSINLNNNNLNGHLPSSIALLSLMQTLTLSYNYLNGSVPPQIGNLTALTTLQLDANRFSGQIPSSIGNLRTLRNLYLSYNYFSGTLPDVFGEMRELRDFRLTNTQVTGPLPSSIGFQGAKLYKLLLNNNKFGGPIPPTWSNLRSLIDLELGVNELTGELPSFIGNWTNLSILDIHNNRFTGDFPSTISTSGVCSLIASNNYFTSVPVSLLSRPGLTAVYFDNNDLVSVPDFGSYSNRTNLALKLENNRLDFSQLERQVGKGIKALTQIPQKTINDNSTQAFTPGDKLVLTARPATPRTIISWERLGPNGVTWSAANNDEDNVSNTYTRNASTLADAGTYRWTSTSAIVTGITIQSDPIVVKTSQAFTLDNWCFQYRYDGRKRMTHKKAPGADWVYMVYDDRDRLVMTQDGEQRKTNKWTVTKYDQLNRPVVTALYTHVGYLSQEAMAGLVSKTLFAESFTGSGVSGYTNGVFPTTNLELLTATYYDNYSFLSGDPNLTYKSDDVAGQYKFKNMADTSFPLVTGMATGMRVKVLEAPYYLTIVNYYDDKGRVVQTVSENFDAGIDRVSNSYDFTGKVISTRTTHSVNNIHWQNLVHMQAEGNLMRRLVTNQASGGSSMEFIPAGIDGWAEATVTETNAVRYWGLSDADPDQLSTSIDYCFYLSGPALIINENGVGRGTMATISSGDRLRIERKGTTIRYYRNGTLLYTSPIPSTTLLRLDVTLGTNGSTLLNLTLSGNVATQTTLTEFDYDHAGRLLATRHCINNGDTVLLSKNEYNELGQLIDKKLHRKPDGDFSQSIDYRYNIRAWLTSLNGASIDETTSNDGDADSNRDLFGIDLHYNNVPMGLNNNAVFNGNISAMQWRVNLGLSDTTMRGYTFGYDPMNRLKQSRQKIFDTSWKSESAFYEDSLRYDLNGNITSLRRVDGKGAMMDKLSYRYGNDLTNGNQLLKVSDKGDVKNGFTEDLDVYNDYTYDRNGNMITDNNKHIGGITYNILNLPGNVWKTTGETMQYYYDATGRKLGQVVKDASGLTKKTADYHGNFIYENDTLKFANHEEGRVIMTSGKPEYQYYLKDHLGNVRMTFTTKEERDESIANFESPTATFLYYDEAAKVNSLLFDHTNTGETHYSARLNGTPGERVGLARSLSVMPGDTIRMEVYAKYLDTNPDNWSAALNAFVSSIANGTAATGTFVDGGAVGSTGGVMIPWLSFLKKVSDVGPAPGAYLNYLVFDRDYNFINGDAIPLSSSAREYGQNGPHERLASDLLIKKAGYVYIYLSNDNVAAGGEKVEVYFDDFKVEHVKSPVVQTQDYYPFGLRFNSFTQEALLPDKARLFQGQEHIDDLGLNWDSFKFRNYQPEIGRFFNVDPLADKYLYNSPYAFSENHVTTHIELEGLEKVGINHDGLEEALDRAATNTTIVERSGSSIKVASLDANGGVMNSTTITLPSHEKQGEVSDKSAKAIGEVAMTVNDKQVTISSVRRNAAEQGRAMMQNLAGNGRGQGIVAQRSLYSGKPGGQVVSTFTKYKALQGIASQFGGRVMNSQIQNALVSKVAELGVHNVTNHASLDTRLNVIDVSPRSVENNSGFVDAAKAHPSVEKFIPYPKDPGNHFEIRN